MLATFNGLDLLGIVLVAIGALYVGWRLDRWEQDRELDRRWEETMRQARGDLDRPFDRDAEDVA